MSGGSIRREASRSFNLLDPEPGETFYASKLRQKGRRSLQKPGMIDSAQFEEHNRPWLESFDNDFTFPGGPLLNEHDIRADIDHSEGTPLRL